MFHVPNAKRIKRSELFQVDDDSQSQAGSETGSRAGSPAQSDADTDAVVPVPNYGFEYEIVEAGEAPNNRNQTPEQHDEEEEQEYQFRLFTTSSKPKTGQQPSTTTTTTTTTTTKPTIRLSRTPSPVPEGLSLSLSLDKAHFINPSRPETYYFTASLPQETIQILRRQYTEAALSTNDILVRAKATKWPGTSLPWRVIHVKKAADRTKKSSSQSNDDPGKVTVNVDGSTVKSKSKSKPGKKRRIVLRRRLAKKAEFAAQAQVAELTEKEKRTRRNREKKVKRKEREKRKKEMEKLAGAGPQMISNDWTRGEGGEGGGVSQNSDGDGSN
ncbi:hypothetical protein HRR83_006436 [Exophiala dermatitidis]|uniref:Uncharacterized protein n=2 Tax=Exophiala dermatitidis TaxID=5970 RepID=H6CAB3_EXODN|nr:uncharacterized protein HMPREF1120_08049 [Exophiala dermatitidis NIH/UT8656]KAJ4503644.1 hypothetical protein HRR75_008038 [Exophiala dermatitidis]EHY60077.1 hypothetical protein HMPREF1120_08049 [Exophiala dermatitidis NIH/UT8656]KAJ4504537.1 hypothetical protein HRR73_008711 [Exophiala dermatitidis]KAJ4505377.1 hypothetical protein HRR74_008748 [Exophiala dermatitidis]KAJ4530635.1 hypothetical protein HRR76_008335 [Exophiala dermatitidis]